MTMRYQRVSPDSVPVSNGRRTNSPSNPSWKTCKEEEDKVEIYGNLYMKTPNPTFEGKGVSRFRSPSKNSPDFQNGNNDTNTFAAEDPNSPPTCSNNSARNHQNIESNGLVGGGGGDTFLQWGHRKRSRCSRGVALADDTSSSTSGAAQVNNSAKIQRRSTAPPQLSSSSSSLNANIMPPPSLPPTSNGIHSGSNLKAQARNASSNPPPPPRRNTEEQSQPGGSSRVVSGRSRAGKRTLFLDRKNPCSTSSRDDKKMNGCPMQHSPEAVILDESQVLSPPHLHHQQAGCSSVNVNDNNTARSGRLVAGAASVGGGEKVGGGGGGEVHHWPKIYIPLSRKEKEEDFLAMKGTKLPHRPKKRSKAIDRIIQFCYPGMWLSDLTKGRYEVREKKCPKKQQKRRGLKGMESMESDSE